MQKQQKCLDVKLMHNDIHSEMFSNKSHCTREYIVACHLPRGSKLRWREDMGGGLPNNVKYTLLNTDLCTTNWGVGRDTIFILHFNDPLDSSQCIPIEKVLVEGLGVSFWHSSPGRVDLTGRVKDSTTGHKHYRSESSCLSAHVPSFTYVFDILMGVGGGGKFKNLRGKNVPNFNCLYLWNRLTDLML